MTLNKINNKLITFIPPNSIPRTIIIKTSQRRWCGCIYYSSYVATSGIILLIKSLSKECEMQFLKNPFFIFKSYKKSEVEIKINNKLYTLLKKKQYAQ